MHPKTIGLIAHTGKPGIGELINSLVAEFKRHSIAILLEKETAAAAKQKSDLRIREHASGSGLLVGFHQSVPRVRDPEYFLVDHIQQLCGSSRVKLSRKMAR